MSTIRYSHCHMTINQPMVACIRFNVNSSYITMVNLNWDEVKVNIHLLRPLCYVLKCCIIYVIHATYCFFCFSTLRALCLIIFWNQGHVRLRYWMTSTTQCIEPQHKICQGKCQRSADNIIVKNLSFEQINKFLHNVYRSMETTPSPSPSYSSTQCK